MVKNEFSGYSAQIELCGQEYIVKGLYDPETEETAYIHYTRSLEDIREKGDGSLEQLAELYL